MMLQSKLTRSILLAGGISALAACGGGSSSGSNADEGSEPSKYVVFNASVTGTDYALWRSDGTAAGTQSYDSTTEYNRGQTAFKRKVYFTSSKNLGSGNKNYAWVSDGSTEIQIKDINDNPIEHAASSYDKGELFVEADDKLYFMGKTGTHSSNRKLYQINADGLTAKEVADFSNLNDLAFSSNTRELGTSGKPFSDGKSLYVTIGFANSSGAYRYRPHRINLNLSSTHKLEELTNSGTVIISHPFKAAYRANGQTYLHLGTSVYTLGDAKNSMTLLTGGSPEKLLQLGDGSLIGYIASSRSFYNVSSSGLSSITLNGSSLSTSWNSNHIQLPTGTQPELVGDSKLYFLYGNATPFDVVSIDKNGTVTKLSYPSGVLNAIAAPSKIKGFSSNISQSWRTNGHVFFGAEAEPDMNTGAGNPLGHELWAINEADGSVNITSDIHRDSNSSIISGAISSNPTILGIINNRLIFEAAGGKKASVGTGRELWSSDGTYNGTSIIKDIAPGTDDGIGSTVN